MEVQLQLSVGIFQLKFAISAIQIPSLASILNLTFSVRRFMTGWFVGWLVELFVYLEPAFQHLLYPICGF